MGIWELIWEKAGMIIQKSRKVPYSLFLTIVLPAFCALSRLMMQLDDICSPIPQPH